MTDAATLAAFGRGEPDAVRRLYATYGRLVHAVARRIVGSDLADEVTQETFVKAWRAADTYQSDRDPAPWLATIARRTALDVQRREGRRRTEALEETHLAAAGASRGAVVDLAVARNADVWAVRAAVDELPLDEREVVRLQHLEQLTQTEIAARLGLPLGTVKSRAFRAHRRLAAALAEWNDGAS